MVSIFVCALWFLSPCVKVDYIMLWFNVDYYLLFMSVCTFFCTIMHDGKKLWIYIPRNCRHCRQLLNVKYETKLLISVFTLRATLKLEIVCTPNIILIYNVQCMFKKKKIHYTITYPRNFYNPYPVHMFQKLTT